MQSTRSTRGALISLCVAGFAAAACSPSPSPVDSGTTTDTGLPPMDTGMRADVAATDAPRADVPLSMVNGTWSIATSGVVDRVASIWGSGAGNVWATAGQNMLHFTGTSWAHEVAPYSLYAVSGSAANDVWVSASTIPPNGSGETGRDVFRHSTGTTWTDSMLTTTAHSLGIFVRAANDAWAAGQGAALHYDGTRWAPSGTGIVAGDLLTGVWMAGAGDVTVVGQQNYRLSGTTWMLQPRIVAGEAEYYHGVWGFAADDIWAVGDFVAHFGGALPWVDVDPNTDAPLNAVWGSAPNDIWAVGRDGVIVHWNGSVWANVPSGTTQELSSIWGSGPDDIWAGGDGGTLLHYRR